MENFKSLWLRQNSDVRFALICVGSGVMLVALTMLIGLALIPYGMMLK